MSYTFRIRDNDTKEIRIGKMDLDWWHDDIHAGRTDSTFWWQEGNFSCDCNRGDEWQRAGGVKEEDLDDSPCGMTRYTVLDVTLEDGTVVPIDDLAVEEVAEEKEVVYERRG